MKLFINNILISDEIEVIDANVEVSNEIFIEFSPFANMEEIKNKIKNMDIQIIQAGNDTLTLFEAITSFKIEKGSVFVKL